MAGLVSHPPRQTPLANLTHTHRHTHNTRMLAGYVGAPPAAFRVLWLYHYRGANCASRRGGLVQFHLDTQATIDYSIYLVGLGHRRRWNCSAGLPRP